MGLGIIPGTGWSASDIRTIARETEAAGFEGSSPPRSITTSWQLFS